LEDGSILLRPALSYERMVLTKLEKTPEEWKPRNFRKALDMWSISPIQKSVDEERDCCNSRYIYCERHD
jgi:hypothetical protein